MNVEDILNMWVRDYLGAVITSPLALLAFFFVLCGFVLICILKYQKATTGDPWSQDDEFVRAVSFSLLIGFGIFVFPITFSLILLGSIIWGFVTIVSKVIK